MPPPEVEPLVTPPLEVEPCEAEELSVPELLGAVVDEVVDDMPCAELEGACAVAAVAATKVTSESVAIKDFFM